MPPAEAPAPGGSSRRLTRAVLWVLPVVAALAVGIALLALAGAPPLEALRVIFDGAFGDAADTANTLMAWAPLVLAAAGLCITFAAGLWNIGIDGQITFGAITAAAAARMVPGPSVVVIPAVILAGIVGGALWGLAAGLLRTRRRGQRDLRRARARLRRPGAGHLPHHRPVAAGRGRLDERHRAVPP